MKLIVPDIPHERTSCLKDVNSVKMMTTSGMFMMQEFNERGSESLFRAVIDDRSFNRSNG